MASAIECIRLIRDAAGDLSDDEITEIVEELERRRRARRAVDDLRTVEEALLNDADELAQEIVEAAQIERRNRLLNIKIRQEVRDLAARAAEQMGDPSLALEARNVGVNAPLLEGRLSVDARGNALAAEYMGGLIADLRRENLLTVFNARHLEREIARELAEVTKPDGNPGLTGSAEARRIAHIIDKYRKAAIARENRAGAWIKPRAGYITRQTHDMHRVRRAGFEEWFNFILPKLDPETFQGADPRQFLRAAYDGLVTGRHLRFNGGEETDLTFAFKGPGNLAKRASQQRVLHFKSADDWFDYNERFGQRSLTESILSDLERAARNTALMEAWGTNPRALFDTVLEELKDRHRGDVRIFDRLNRQSLQNQFAEIDGTARIPVEPTLARVGASIRAIESMAKLGGAVLSALTDLGFMASEIRFQRGNLLASWGRTLTNFLDGVAPGDRRRVAELIGVGLDGQIGDIAARFSAQDDLPGRASKWMQRFFKLNLLGPWTDANKRGLGLMMARDLAMEAGRGWDALPARTRGLLMRYGFDARKWDIARQAVTDAPDGRAYLMPDAIQVLPDAAFGDLAPREIRRLKDEISTALRAYYVDRVDFGTPTPGARERAILRQGTRPGTVSGEAWRFVTQFKAFPITVLTKPMGRELFGHGARTFREALLRGQGDILGLAHIIVGTTVLGYLAQSAKEIAKGRTPRDPTDLSTWSAAMLQGGGLGIYGDFLFGEFNRFGHSALSTAAGPTLGTVDDLMELWARAREGEDVAASGLRFLLSNTPFINLFYTRAALNWLIIYQLQEAANPGYLRRMERRIRKENKQTFLIPPSSAIPTGGGTRLFEGVR